MWETGQREWVAHLIREKRLPAELQRGGSSHEQARLLSQQEATIGRTKMGQLPFDDKEPIENTSGDRIAHVASHGRNRAPELPYSPGKKAGRSPSSCQDGSRSTELSSRLEHKESRHQDAARLYTVLDLSVGTDLPEPVGVLRALLRCQRGLVGNVVQSWGGGVRRQMRPFPAPEERGCTHVPTHFKIWQQDLQAPLAEIKQSFE